MVTLSVVVPVYRVEPYLEQCVDSILAQSFTDFELILVDDGSPDRCPVICDEYSQKDARVRVIHQENRGLVLARRAGVEASSGKYVTFVDGDDWIEPDLMEKISVWVSRDPDIIVTGLTEDRDGVLKTAENAASSGVYEGEAMQRLLSRAVMAETFYRPGIMPSLCNKWIRRELFDRYGLSVDPGIRMGEDAAVSYPVLFHARSVVVDNGICGYHYRIVDASMSHTYGGEYFRKAKTLADSLYSSLAGYPEALRQLPYYLMFILDNGLIWVTSRSSGNSLKQMTAEVRQVTEDFRLPERLAETDLHMLAGCQRKKAEALRRNQPLRYVWWEWVRKMTAPFSRKA